VLYCFYFSDTEAFEACFRLLHDDDDDEIRDNVSEARDDLCGSLSVVGNNNIRTSCVNSYINVPQLIMWDLSVRI